MLFRPQATAEYANVGKRGVLLFPAPAALGWLLVLASVALLSLISLLAFARVRVSVEGYGELLPSEKPLPVLAPGAVKVESVRVSPGQKVKMGEALFELDTSELKAAVAESARRLDKLREAQLRAQRLLEPRRTVSSSDIGSQEFMSYMLAQHLEHLEDLLQKEQERSELLLKQAERATVKSPHDGTIVGPLAQPGTPAREGETLATLLPSSATLRAYVHLPESEIGRIEKGTLVYLRLYAYPYERYGMAEGRVLGVLDTLDTQDASATHDTHATDVSVNGSFTVEVELTKVQSPMQLRPGLRFAASLVTGERAIWSLIFPR